MRLHPATQILTWCVLVTAIQFLAPAGLFIAGSLVLSFAFVLSRHKLVQLVRRTRWILFSLWLIYAYSTPGQLLVDAPFAPSREGLLEGGVQLMRLLAALAGLAILLNRLHRQQLMAGLYTLFAPLHWLGLSRERLAVRLALTLQYAEVTMLRETRTWQEVLHSLTPENKEQHTGLRQIKLPLYRFARVDGLLLTGVVLLLWLATI